MLNSWDRYRKVAADRTEKNLKYVASALEMGAVASFLLDPTRRDADADLDKAYMAHLRAGEHRLWYSPRFRLVLCSPLPPLDALLSCPASFAIHSVRSTILLSEILRVQRNWRDLINALLRCAERPEADDVRAAFL